jgi:hypothetical protein
MRDSSRKLGRPCLAVVSSSLSALATNTFVDIGRVTIPAPEPP